MYAASPLEPPLVCAVVLIRTDSLFFIPGCVKISIGQQVIITAV